LAPQTVLPESPMNILAQRAALQNAQNQNKLFDMKADEYQRGIQEDHGIEASVCRQCRPESTAGRIGQGQPERVPG
jgi:hypothetical protein